MSDCMPAPGRPGTKGRSNMIVSTNMTVLLVVKASFAAGMCSVLVPLTMEWQT